VPPLDGSKVLTHFLPYNAKQWFYNNSQMFYILFLLLFVTGLSSVVVQPIVGTIWTGMEWAVESLFGLF
jgi:Zn-dependent protease